MDLLPTVPGTDHAPGIQVVRDSDTGQTGIILDQQSTVDLMQLLDSLPAAHDYGNDLGLYDDGDQVSYTVAILRSLLNKVIPSYDR